MSKKKALNGISPGAKEKPTSQAKSVRNKTKLTFDDDDWSGFGTNWDFCCRRRCR